MKIRNIITAAAMCAATNASADVYVCDPCDAGTYASVGAVSCTACRIGTYAVGKGNSSCTSCPSGTYQDQAGQTGCKACGEGTYSATGASSCTNCPAGTYQGSASQGSCSSCAGTVYNNRQNCCPSVTNYWNGSNCVNWVTCGANATRQSNNTCSCNSGYDYNGGSSVPASTACSKTCVQTEWTYTGERRCTATSSHGPNNPNLGGYCWCKQTRNSCGTGANEQWANFGWHGSMTTVPYQGCMRDCPCK
jgi:syndecan 4